MTSAYLGVALFDVLVCASGYAVLEGMGLAAPLGRLRSIGLAFFTGWACTGILLSVVASLDGPVDLAVVIGALAVVAAAALTVRRFFTHGPIGGVTRERGLARAAAIAGLALVGAALVAALVAAAAAPADPSWDTWAFWLPKANSIYFFHGLDTGPGGFTAWANPEYPPLYPLMAAAAAFFTGGPHPSLLPLQSCLVGISFVASAVVILRRFVRAWILYPSLALLTMSPEFWNRLPIVLPDQTVACQLAIAALACVLWIVQPRGAWLALATLMLGAATLTKPEGFMLGLLLVVVMLAAAAVVHRRAAAPALVLLLGPATNLLWRRWLDVHDQPTGADVYRWSDIFHVHFLADRAWRLDYAAGRLTHYLFAWSIWTAVLPLAAVAALLAVRRAPAVALALLAWLLVGFAGLLTTYWIGKPEVHWYVTTSGERVIATLPVVAGTAMPLLLMLSLGRAGRR